ncbi:hemerythrin HHE cation binding domain-containing protein [Pacificibacter maritimus]|uniref:Hemerythrin HHE cation binding domain-containing protein n=1 Tax=Pacificibacter maritimus TaxID=762213 RepID=A0A3N4U6Y9_9RHOB|nr:hemerythrin domain-containing protein [Pacificibacter maritimus]RPE66222.1 hemerythrin HHE cation binding domain-containing protein [Pacificibacter maritimus]
MTQTKIDLWQTVDAAMTALDEGARPKAPVLSNDDQARQSGKRLAAIHRMHLRDIVTAKALLLQIEQTGAGAAELAQAIPKMSMTQNYQRFGNLCGRECMVLNMHHNLEEQEMFPRLEQQGVAALSAVVAKLRTEHQVVHALIERLYEAAVDLVDNPSTTRFETARLIFEQLEAVVRSHFKYEETELEEALGLFMAL